MIKKKLIGFAKQKILKTKYKLKHKVAPKAKAYGMKAKAYGMKAASHVKKNKGVYGSAAAGAAAGAGAASIYKAGKRKGKSMRGRPRKRRR